MKKAVIISGGNVNFDFALDFLKDMNCEICIGADRGLEFLKKAGMKPTHIVGDFDSSAKEAKAYFEQFDEIPVYAFNPEKDFTDTDIALRLALELGASQIYILGGTGTRLDHVLANIRTLYLALEQGKEAFLLDENNRIRLINQTFVLKKKEQYGKYVSMYALGETIKDLTLEGFFYPLKDYTLTAMDALTVSNEIVEKEGKISFGNGTLILMESRD